jgi:hypothetical protein
MWFTLVLRYFGVSGIVTGLNSFVTAYNVHLGYYTSAATVGAFVNHGVEGLAIGAVLLLGAPQISALLVKPLPVKASAPEGTDPQNV